MKYLQTYNLFKSIPFDPNRNSLCRSLTKDEFKSILNRFCKNFDWNDTPIYKGMYIDGDFALTNPKGQERRSANTANYYTVIFDNSPYLGEFPKRSQSLICSTDLNTAGTYGVLYRVIPFDGAKIAVCSNPDFWHAFEKNIKYYSLDEFNVYLGIIFSFLYDKYDDENLEELREDKLLIEQLKHLYDTYNLDDEIDSFCLQYPGIKDVREEFNNFPKSLEELFQAFNPNNNEIKLYDYKDYSKSFLSDLEIWTDSKALLLKVDLYDDNGKSIAMSGL
ncbi:hypothetical protein M0Q97_06635 [Candidatus Dojkabacteria bacterium]|jgi:hypothetical protein|nr:hypothetical protein [Candidatus Dojkabacteria bacterium]